MTLLQPSDRAQAGPRRRAAVLDAVIDELACHGYQRSTIEGVSARAGVHKATLYRWWPNKAALVADALAAHMLTGPVPDTGSTRDDLVAWLSVTIANYTTTPAGLAMPALISDLAASPGGLDAFRAAFLSARRAGCAAVLRRGVERGDLRRDLDLDLFMDALAGTVFYRQLVSGQPMAPDISERITDLLLAPATGDPCALAGGLRAGGG